MFSGCYNLEYINLINFDKNNSVNVENMLQNIPKNVVMCIKGINSGEQIISEFKNDDNCTNIDCTIDWKIKQKKIIDNDNNNKKYIESCDKSPENKYEYN